MRNKCQSDKIKNFVLRQALASDSADILEWRNDRDSRSASIDQKKISQSDHERWFCQMLKGGENLCFIGENTDGKIGIVRFEAVGKKVWEVSINLNPKFRHLGWGEFLLGEAGRYFLNMDPSPCILRATVKDENFASRRIFEKCGYIFDRKRGRNLFFQYVGKRG